MTHQPGGPVDRSVRLPADLAGMLEEEARLQDSTAGTIMRQALRAYLTVRQSARAADEQQQAEQGAA